MNSSVLDIHLFSSIHYLLDTLKVNIIILPLFVMPKEIYTRKRSSEPSTNRENIFASNQHVFIDTGELAPPFRFIGMHHAYLGGINAMALVDPSGWRHIKPELLSLARENLFENSRMFMHHYGKIKTIDSVADEWRQFLNKINYAIGNISQEIKSRPRVMNELMKLRVPSEYILNGLKTAVVPFNSTIKDISEMLGLFKAIPLDIHERRKLRMDAAKRKEVGYPTLTDEHLFATAIYSAIFEEKNTALISRDSDMYKMMQKTLAYLRRDSTSFTRKLCKAGPEILYHKDRDLYDVYTFKNSNPAPVSPRDFERMNGRLNDLVTDLTFKYEETRAEKNY